jgi:hypothetical protein
MGHPPRFGGFSAGRLKVAYGYRVGEVPLKPINPVKEGTVLMKFRESVTEIRKPMLFSVGMSVRGSSLPHPDIGSSHTLLAGVAARFATRPPEPDPELLRRFSDFVAQWIKANLQPLSPDTDVSFETWVEQTNYPEWRRNELRQTWERHPFLTKKETKVKMFMKKESYAGGYKHGRAINSRSDAFKTHVGPYFAAIEKEVFKSKHFIKKVPVNQRARYVYEMLHRTGSSYYASDFVSFEALFTRAIMEACEFQLYEFMTQNLAGGKEFMELVRNVLGGRNVIENKHLSLLVEATRMSGEMCTSLGNGFSNLMFNLFMAKELGAEIDGVVEGDDGLFVIKGPVPTERDFARLGLIVKLEKHERLETASFCGQVFDPQNFVVITDPRKVLNTVGWIDGDYIRAKRGKQLGLLRAKAWSFGYQYPACPIVSSLSRCILRLTRSMDHRVALQSRNLDMYTKELLQQAFDAGRPELNQPIDDCTRDLMERVFGITPQDQLRVEKYFDDLEELGDIPNFFPVDSWSDYASRYVVDVAVDHYLDIPPETWVARFDCILPPELAPG